MGLLQKVWPFSEIERLKKDNQRQVIELVKQGNELSELRSDNRRYLKMNDGLNKDLNSSNTWAKYYKDRLLVVTNQVASQDKRIATMVEELDFQSKRAEKSETESTRFADSILFLQKENEALRAKLSRKGTKHKKTEAEPVKNRPF